MLESVDKKLMYKLRHHVECVYCRLRAEVVRAENLATIYLSIVTEFKDDVSHATLGDGCIFAKRYGIDDLGRGVIAHSIGDSFALSQHGPPTLNKMFDTLDSVLCDNARVS